MRWDFYMVCELCKEQIQVGVRMLGLDAQFIEKYAEEVADFLEEHVEEFHSVIVQPYAAPDAADKTPKK